jgi:hypothetical protein
VAPQKALELLQRDLEMVVGDPKVADFPLGIAPFLETEFAIEPTSSGITTMPLSYMRKKVINNFCLVGEETTLQLSLASYLSKAIEVQAIKLFVVAFDTYEALFHNKRTITDSDAFRILSIDAPITIDPGVNSYTFNWVPMNTGQYILSTVQIQWKLACFYYHSAAFRRPLLGVHVLPSEPTQTLDLNPLSLIPGHVQQVRVTFNSGSDYIREGSINLLCFEGLHIVPPGTDPGPGNWSRFCEIDLPSCPPGEKVEITTFVKTSSFNVGGVQGMQAKVATAYCHALYAKLSEEEKKSTPAMKSVLEATISTLDRPALTVDSASAFTYAKNRVMISVTLHCNAPLPFFIKEWSIKLPKLHVGDGADLNQDLFGHAVSEGDQIFFTFDCSNREEANECCNLEPTLDIVLEDEFGKTLDQVLFLDLDQFYEQLRIEDEFICEGHIAVELLCSAAEGPVGAPVTFTYSVDIHRLSKPQKRNITSPAPRANGVEMEPRLLYKISCDETEWIVSGKTEGEFGQIFTLDFVGIPLRPGLLKRFPEMRVYYESIDRDLPPIELRSLLPKSFNSLPFLNQMVLACPSSEDD